jgi:hypothetical protein
LSFWITATLVAHFAFTGGVDIVGFPDDITFEWSERLESCLYPSFVSSLSGYNRMDDHHQMAQRRPIAISFVVLGSGRTGSKHELLVACVVFGVIV